MATPATTRAETRARRPGPTGRVPRRDWTRTPTGWVLEPGWKDRRGAVRAVAEMQKRTYLRGVQLGRDGDGHATVVVESMFNAAAGWMGGSATKAREKEATQVLGLFEKKRTCARCREQGRWKGEETLCPNCQRQTQSHAAHEGRQQEQDYLINWLHTRQGDQDPLTRRLRAKAEAEGLDWSRPVRHGQVVLFDVQEARQEVGA